MIGDLRNATYHGNLVSIDILDIECLGVVPVDEFLVGWLILSSKRKALPDEHDVLQDLCLQHALAGPDELVRAHVLVVLRVEVVGELALVSLQEHLAGMSVESGVLPSFLRVESWSWRRVAGRFSHGLAAE